MALMSKSSSYDIHGIFCVCWDDSGTDCKIKNSLVPVNSVNKVVCVQLCVQRVGSCTKVVGNSGTKYIFEVFGWRKCSNPFGQYQNSFKKSFITYVEMIFFLYIWNLLLVWISNWQITLQIKFLQSMIATSLNCPVLSILMQVMWCNSYYLYACACPNLTTCACVSVLPLNTFVFSLPLLWNIQNWCATNFM